MLPKLSKDRKWKKTTRQEFNLDIYKNLLWSLPHLSERIWTELVLKIFSEVNIFWLTFEIKPETLSF